jgi:4-amino-4-deoxy-L-arabinose transferase-like glycosyltransferase
MIDCLARKPATLYLLLAAYFALNAVLRLASPASLELDEGQQLYFAQWFSLGYGPQPPLYNWLQYATVQVFGNSVAALTLLKNALLFLSFALFGLTAQSVLRNQALAVMATLGLFTMPQISYEAQRDLTHTVALLFAACLFLYALVRAIERPTLFNYGLTGLAIGLGMLSKYNFILLPAAAFLALASDRDLRSRLLDPRLLATVAIAAVVFAPHGWWLLGHMTEATDSTLGKMDGDVADVAGRLKGALSLIGAIAVISLPPLAVFLLAFGGGVRRAWPAQSRWTRLLGRILIAAIVLLFLVVLSGAATQIKSRWLVALFFLLPLYLAAKVEALGEPVSSGALRRFAIPVIAVMVLVPLTLFGRPWLAAFGQYGKQNVPYGPAIEEILKSRADAPSLVLASDQQLAGNARLNAADIPALAPANDGLDHAFTWSATRPILAIWRDRRGGKLEPELDKTLKDWLAARGMSATMDVHSIARPYHYGKPGDVYHFSYAWIYPPAGL